MLDKFMLQLGAGGDALMRFLSLMSSALMLFVGVSFAQAQGSQWNPSYPPRATALSSSATGTTGATTATLGGAFGQWTYICGFTFGGTNATGANTSTTVTITGTISGTLNYPYTTLAAAATVPNTPPLNVNFFPCLPASAQNSAIVVNGPALGAGATLATVTAWGYQFPNP